MGPVMRDEVVLQGVDLTRSFGDGESRTYALRDVSLELERGQLALLMGPSGSGKSTLLAVLSGLLEPDKGRVLAKSGRSSRKWVLLTVLLAGAGAGITTAVTTAGAKSAAATPVSAGPALTIGPPVVLIGRP